MIFVVDKKSVVVSFIKEIFPAREMAKEVKKQDHKPVETFEENELSGEFEEGIFDGLMSTETE